jgi:hypothetical protein
MTFTPGELASLISGALYTKDYPFLGDYPDRGNVLTQWPYIDPRAVAAGIPEQAFDFHCMKECTANDGNVYQQPHFGYNEVTDAGYFMVDFDQKLPWNMRVDGNLGTRYVITTTTATGFMTLAHTGVTPAYNPITNPGAVITTTLAPNTSLTNESKEWLPSGNLNLWLMHDELVLRYYQGRVMSRPPPGAPGVGTGSGAVSRAGHRSARRLSAAGGRWDGGGSDCRAGDGFDRARFGCHTPGARRVSPGQSACPC